MNTDTAMKIISMVESCAVWAALFVAFFFITKASGMKNSLPKEAKARLDNFAKLIEALCTKLSDDKPDTDKQITKMFSKINHCHRKIEKIFAVYVYEHPLSTTSQAAFDTIVSLKDKLLLVSRAIAKGEKKETLAVFPEIAKIVEKSKEQLDLVIKEDEGDKYFKA